MWGYVLMVMVDALPPVLVAVIPCVAAFIVMHRRGPRIRIERASAAIVPALLWCLVGLAAWAGLWLAYINANPDPQNGIAIYFVAAMAVLVAMPWAAVLFTLGAAAGRRGSWAMHLTIAAMALAGVVVGAAVPWLTGWLLAVGLITDDWTGLVLTLAAMPGASGLAALCIAPLLPLGNFGEGRCAACGYSLEGLPQSSTNTPRCPECGYHPSLPASAEDTANGSN
ncbi:MAG: hypothetical protein ACIAQU_06655 [Phycisphaerales bacterium JB064]